MRSIDPCRYKGLRTLCAMGVAAAIPSMFLRRLMLLGALFCLGVSALTVQAYRLTVMQGERHTEAAESRLLLEKWTPTVRGRILDRKGRVLALDKPGFDVMVSYPVITGEWAYDQAWREARKQNRPAWPKMTPAQRDEAAKRLLPEYERRQAEVWTRLSRALAVPREELDEARNRIISKVQRTVSTTKLRWLEQRVERFGPVNDRGEEMTIRDVDRPVAVERDEYPIATGASEDKLFELRRIESDLPGVRVLESAVRVYPYETMMVTLDRTHYPEPLRGSEPMVAVQVRGVATHALGWMRGIRAEDVASQPRKDPQTGALNRSRYFERDQVGAGGVEQSMEGSLRGKRGVRRQHLDTGEIEHEPSEPGRDVALTIDINLQSRVQALMTPESGLGALQEWHLSPQLDQRPKFPIGTPLNGAAVVLEVSTGEVLAAVSMPSFTRKDVQEHPEKVFADVVNTPYVNRVVAKPYPPGSIVKPLVLASAVSQGVHTLAHRIDCTGHLYPNQPTMYRCWIYKQNHGDTHASYFGGPLNAVQALAASCNIYFYTLGRALGVDGIRKWYGAFGVGTPFNLGIGSEWPGSLLKKLPGPGGRVEPPQLQDAIFMGIGQGPIDWTPLHAADAYATLARGGARIVPRVMKEAPVQGYDLRLDASACDAALDGLYAAVNDMEHGTGSRITIGGVRLPMFNHPDLDVRGKTGTAAAPRIFADLNDDGDKEIAREGDHSWYVVMVGPKGKSPKYVIAAVMEYAGSGGRVSGPIVNQIIWALKAEGYL